MEAYCPLCMVKLTPREDGLLPNHRENGEPCAGSRTEAKYRNDKPVKKSGHQNRVQRRERENL